MMDDETKKEFLRLWNAGVERKEIAAAFGRRFSWVQMMTEITDAPPRRINSYNRDRVLNHKPDDRLFRRRRNVAGQAIRRALDSIFGRIVALEEKQKRLQKLNILSGDSGTFKRSHVLATRSLFYIDRRLTAYAQAFGEDDDYSKWRRLLQNAEDRLASLA